MTKCEIRVTNRDDDPAVLATAVDEISIDFLRRSQKEFP